MMRVDSMFARNYRIKIIDKEFILSNVRQLLCTWWQYKFWVTTPSLIFVTGVDEHVDSSSLCLIKNYRYIYKPNVKGVPAQKIKIVTIFEEENLHKTTFNSLLDPDLFKISSNSWCNKQKFIILIALVN